MVSLRENSGRDIVVTGTLTVEVAGLTLVEMR